MRDAELVVSDDASSRDLDLLERRLYEFNCEATGFRDGRRLVVWLRDSAGRIQAGLSGHTWGGACEVRILWVDASRRHSGIGTRLLRAAEEEARARGCSKIFLSTHGFQAPDFYRRLGYVRVGEFLDYPRGSSQIFLEKPLSPVQGSG
jgi:ribosomal protein S18 acetylase RimI-like enzyme